MEFKNAYTKNEASVHPFPPRETCGKHDKRKKNTQHQREVGSTGSRVQTLTKNTGDIVFVFLFFPSPGCDEYTNKR